MDEQEIVRGMVLRMGRGASASSAVAQAIVEWAQAQCEWLFGEGENEADAMDWARLIRKVAGDPGPAHPVPQVLRLAGDLACLLGFGAFDSALLALMIAFDRLPRVAALGGIASRHGMNLPALLGELAGAEPHDAERLVRRSAVLQLGLICFVANRQGEVAVDVRWALERVLDRAPASGPELIELLIGKQQPTQLELADFAHVGDAPFLIGLLAGALRERAAGINVLIHGPPGTGKTELARLLAADAGAALHGIGEADENGEEPARWERVFALQLAQRVLAGRGGAVLLFDEMEDLIGNANRGAGDWFSQREGSKVFVNRLLETNPLPVIWTTNALGNVDDAILRRMSFILKLDFPPHSTALRMIDRIANDEGIVPAIELSHLIDQAPETSSVLRVAARAARLSGAEDGGARAARSLVCALRDGDPVPCDIERLDLDLFETDLAIAPLFEALRSSANADVSLLLTGPPGTGKTALARQLARAMDRPLLVRRGSDLLSKWVGQTEKQIARAFAEARRRDAVLLFDEADSLLFDRTLARTSWEVGQVNELLTWLDRHPLPVVAATNHAHRLDPASLRRFVFKLELRPLGPERAARAFERFFAKTAPGRLSELTSLTPGDFAVVARQLRHAPAGSAEDILARLADECRVKPGDGGRMGF